MRTLNDKIRQIYFCFITFFRTYMCRNTQSVSSGTTLWYVTVHASFTYNGTLQ